jgi:hypothetical protein
MKRYKFFNLKGKKIMSASGHCSWKVGEWKKEENISICNKGFHCSDTILDALSYVKGDILAIVRTKGKNFKQKDKSVWEEMVLDDAYYWTKKDSVALSIYSAELVIKNHEKEYPNDLLPREAIEAAKKWLKNPTEKNKSAAESAAWSAAQSAQSALSAAWPTRSAAWSAARSAWSAARSAAWSAWSAACPAESAAWSAAQSAWFAARSARSADCPTRSAAWSAERINKKINVWLVKHIKEMKKYE